MSPPGTITLITTITITLFQAVIRLVNELILHTLDATNTHAALRIRKL